MPAWQSRLSDQCLSALSTIVDLCLRQGLGQTMRVCFKSTIVATLQHPIHLLIYRYQMFPTLNTATARGACPLLSPKIDTDVLFFEQLLNNTLSICTHTRPWRITVNAWHRFRYIFCVKIRSTTVSYHNGEAPRSPKVSQCGKLMSTTSRSFSQGSRCFIIAAACCHAQWCIEVIRCSE